MAEASNVGETLQFYADFTDHEGDTNVVRWDLAGRSGAGNSRRTSFGVEPRIVG